MITSFFWLCKLECFSSCQSSIQGLRNFRGTWDLTTWKLVCCKMSHFDSIFFPLTVWHTIGCTSTWWTDCIIMRQHCWCLCCRSIAAEPSKRTSTITLHHLLGPKNWRLLQLRPGTLSRRRPWSQWNHRRAKLSACFQCCGHFALNFPQRMPWSYLHWSHSMPFALS